MITGKERDTETGLDYFGARYFSGAQGRFTSPDPMIITGTRLLDPQGLNLYSYTRNRPTIAIDDGGLGTVVVTVGARQTASVSYTGNGSFGSYVGGASRLIGTDAFISKRESRTTYKRKPPSLHL